MYHHTINFATERDDYYSDIADELRELMAQQDNHVFAYYHHLNQQRLAARPR